MDWHCTLLVFAVAVNTYGCDPILSSRHANSAVCRGAQLVRRPQTRCIDSHLSPGVHIVLNHAEPGRAHSLPDNRS